MQKILSISLFITLLNHFFSGVIFAGGFQNSQLSVANMGRAYAGAGVGYYFVGDDAHMKQVSGSTVVSTSSDDVDVSYTAIVTAEIEDDFGYYALLGLEKDITQRLAVFLEAKYLMLKPNAEVRVASEGGSTVGSTSTGATEVNFEGMGVNVGLSCLW